MLHFLRTVSHSVGAHSSALCLDEDEGPDSDDSDEEATGNEVEQQNITPVAIQPLHEETNDDCEVCLVQKRDARLALVPCGQWPSSLL